MTLSSVIIGTGSYLPEKVLTNNDLAKIVDTSDEWITARTGMKKRHIAADGEFTSDLAVKATERALEDANLTAEDLDAVIVATTTSDMIFPATAVQVQEKIGMKRGFAFDINAVCTGFVYALSVADGLVKSGQAKRIAVIGAETMSRVVDWNDRSTCILFGDGAGAVILEGQESDKGIRDFSLSSDGSLTDILKVPGGISLGNIEAKMIMSGKEVFKHAVEKMSSTIQDLVARNGYKVEEIDWMIPHQANQRILSAVAKRIGEPEEKVISTVADHANTSAASIPLALDVARKDGRIKEGHSMVLAGMGAGLTWGGVIIKL